MNTLAAGRGDERLPTDSAFDRRSDFGARGWSILLIEAALLWISSGSVVHGLNVILPALSQTYDLEYTRLLALATPASWASIAAGFVGAWICAGRGPKFLVLLSLACGGLAFGLMGTWGSTTGFVVLFATVCFFDSCFAYVGGPALVTSWFPRKKGLAFGWCTMGQTFSTATYVPYVSFCFSTLGVQAGFWGITALMAVMFVVVWWFAADRPEELGCSPDNRPMTGVEIARSRAEQESYVCPFTVRQLLGMKDVWFMGLAFGGLYIVIVGLLSQFVPRLVAMGYPLETAILYMSIAAMLGVPGAYMWGWLSQKLGVKHCAMLYLAWYAVALVLNIFELNAVTLWISLVMIGEALGGATNLSMSIVAEKFPRGAFVKAWGIVNPIQSIVRCCAFAILAFGVTYLGGFQGAYAILTLVAFVSMALIWNIDTTPVDAEVTR
ncbi:MFS transporter [Rhodoplanes sp. TEM]|uniref:MFS transporter n=1 Tax=Rhodoplanes tepidamans TaxID=200616 RepID=A0ABT5J3Z8_RHOTP|nr:MULTISPECIES: MFS transporter [Rhodoplanes]MDC7784367.1 MFS transporter [Rhodoplanes tepidamans]MDC7983369.1 MFS transporter [Rhodoplanes sp. TEM]MDQ0354504.1 sugar phosphate permease [Rhodoplanes tepidamans]